MASCLRRREFIGSVSAFGVLPALGVPFVGDLGVRLKIGVLSDIHLRCLPGRADWFRKALEWYRDRGVDAVVIAGDIADSGRVAELKLCADTWFSVFPDDKSPDGRHVERLFVLGNHCVDAWWWAKNNPHYASPIVDESARLADSIGYGDVRYRAWRAIFHEEFQPIWMKRVKGYPVIGAHWESQGAGIEIEAFIKGREKEIDPRLPLFYIQHEHPKNTCFGHWAWGHDDGRSTRALSRYPNAIAFSGHSHYPLTDERSIWQGAFTSINTASLFNTNVDLALRENAHFNRFGYMGEKRPHRMPDLQAPDGHQGQLMSVYDDRVVVERHDFACDCQIGDLWEWRLDVKDRPFAYAQRKVRRQAPEFAPGATVAVTCRDAKVGGLAYDVVFPHAETRGGCRVFEYEVTATLIEDEVDLVQAQRRVVSPDYHYPDEPKFHRDGICTFADADLPLKGTYRFDVRPIECFGRKGAPIGSELFQVMNSEQKTTMEG